MATMTRRDAMAVFASIAAFPLTSGCTKDPAMPPATASEADAIALLDDIAGNLLRLTPETATSLGIDTGTRAGLRAQLIRRIQVRPCVVNWYGT